MNLVNDFVLDCFEKNQQTTDDDFKKKYGSEYKQKLRTEVLKDLFGDIELPSKL